MSERYATKEELKALEDRMLAAFTAAAESALRQSAAISATVVVMNAMLDALLARDDLPDKVRAELETAQRVMKRFWSHVERTELSDEVSDAIGGKPGTSN